MADQGFTDVSMSTHASHYGSINCLAYYGITTGRTADTFAPGANVTRSQMALFLARAADKAGIDLGEAEDQGFTDLNADDTERVDAINLLVGAGIMFGDTETSFDPPSETLFAPTDHVTRWEMAMFLFAFLDHALDSVLIDELPPAIDGEGVGHVELNSPDGEDGTPPDDYFRDARRQTPAHVDDRISAIYELGVTNLTPGEQGVYNPNGLVTRAQMASFIMRTMGHTNLRPAGLTAQSTDVNTQVSVRDADFVPIGDVRTEVFTTNFPDDAFNANGACIGRFVTEQDPSFEACEIDHGDRLTDGETGNALWEGVGLERGNQLVIVCSAEGNPERGEPAEDNEYQFMAGTRGSDTDYTIYAWSSSIGDEANADDLFQSVPANVLTELTEAVKFVVTGVGSGTADADTGAHPGLHFKMGQTVTFTVQLLDEDGDPVGPTPGVNNYFNVIEDTFIETVDAPPDSGAPVVANSPSAGLTGEVYQGSDPIPDTDEALESDPERIYARDDVVDTNPSFPTEDDRDFSRIPRVREPDSSGRFTVTVGYRDPTRLLNNADALVRVTITPARGNLLEAREMTRPGGQATITGNSVQVPDVRFSDNAPLATIVDARAAAYRLRSLLRNRNSISASVLDQYGVLYRGGQYEIAATDTDHPSDANADPVVVGDFPNPFAVSRSGRRSLGYTHTGISPERQDVTLQLRLPGIAAKDENDDDTSRDDTVAVASIDVVGVSDDVTILWASVAAGPLATGQNTTGLPILMGDPGANFIVVDSDNDVDTDNNAAAIPVAYPYGADDNFVVEGASVTMDQFEEILAQHDPFYVRGGLIESLGTLTWAGYDFSRPRDGATWTITGLLCREPPTGD